jgi:hypothetical protein
VGQQTVATKGCSKQQKGAAPNSSKVKLKAVGVGLSNNSKRGQPAKGNSQKKGVRLSKQQ